MCEVCSKNRLGSATNRMLLNHGFYFTYSKGRTAALSIGIITLFSELQHYKKLPKRVASKIFRSLPHFGHTIIFTNFPIFSNTLNSFSILIDCTIGHIHFTSISHRPILSMCALSSARGEAPFL